MKKDDHLEKELHEHVSPDDRQLFSGRGTWNAQKWGTQKTWPPDRLGQFLTIDPADEMVAVRIRRHPQEVRKLSVDGDTFPTFIERAWQLVKR